jgi:hypothetical protein
MQKLQTFVYTGYGSALEVYPPCSHNNGRGSHHVKLLLLVAHHQVALCAHTFKEHTTHTHRNLLYSSAF